MKNTTNTTSNIRINVMKNLGKTGLSMSDAQSASNGRESYFTKNPNLSYLY